MSDQQQDKHDGTEQESTLDVEVAEEDADDVTGGIANSYLWVGSRTEGTQR